MKQHICRIITLSATCVALSALTGCGAGDTHVEASGPSSALAGVHDRSHEHGDTGPHGGHLIELGRNHKYHAELVENDVAETVTVYILDIHMKEVAIDARTIIVNLNVGTETLACEMAASGDRHSASRFESSDQGLFQALKQRGEVFGKLRVTIEGVPYVGRIAHRGHICDDATHRH